jgi:hypothetical protein
MQPLKNGKLFTYTNLKLLNQKYLLRRNDLSIGEFLFLHNINIVAR